MPAAWVAGVGAVAGAYSSSQATKAQKQATAANAPDPRIKDMLFGKDGGTGLLDEYKALGQTPQSGGLLAYGQGADNYLKDAATGDMQAMRDTAGKMAGSNISTPWMGNPDAHAKGNMVEAPQQNNVNTTNSFNSLINGEAGNNPYLTGAIQKGINQSSNAFGNLVSDAKSATQDVLGSVRSNSVLAGQYGGSRQGLLEGKAFESMNTQLGRAASQFGQNNTDAAVAAQAGAYDADRNRQLSATTALSGQQYNVAQQDAQTKNAAEFMNVGNVFDAQKMRAGLQQSTNSLNSANQVAGLGAQQGLLGMTVGAAQGQDSYALNKAGQAGGLLQPYLSQPGAQVQPTFNNAGAGAVSGAAAGLGLFNLYKQSQSQPYGGAVGNSSQPYGSNGVF